jgi:outer membrane protein assembly factor BamB
MTQAPNQPGDPPAKAASPRPIRWWPAAAVLLLAAGTIVWVWATYAKQRQDRILATTAVGLLALLLLLVWCLFFSRLRWKLRLGVFGGVLCLVSLIMALFRFHGVTGDLVPVFQPRWESQSRRPMGERPKTAPNALLASLTQLTNDWPQFLGPHRNSVVGLPRLARDWKAQAPQRLWLQPVGTGWSGFAVAGTRAITQEQHGESETVVCYDLLTGAPIWSYAYPAHFQSPLAGEGPRATPTLAEGRVYALGSTGILNCLDLETGKLAWSKDIMRDNGAKVKEWGTSGSPLIVNGLVVVSPGGHENRSLVAYRAATGDFVWGNGTDSAGYSSPFLVTLAGVAQIVIFNSGGVSAHDPLTGTNLWTYRWPAGHPHVSMPIVLPGDCLLVSSGYGNGSELLKIQADAQGKLAATRLWKTTRLKAKFTNLVFRDGYIYGLDDGVMTCLDAKTGEQKWKAGRYGHGQEILVGGLLLVTAESGEVILLDPSPKEPRELTRFAALKGKTWNPPALAGQYLVVRNDKDAACYRLPLAPQGGRASSRAQTSPGEASSQGSRGGSPSRLWNCFSRAVASR